MQSTFNKNHPDCYEARAAVLNAFWDVSREDEILAETALRAGTMNGRRHSETEMQQLKSSPAWRRRHGEHIRRYVKSKVEVDDALNKTWVRHKVTALAGEEPGQGRLHKGRSLFSPESRAAFENAKKNSGHIQDNLPREQMYLQMSLSSRSQHGVAVHESQRAEPKAEGYHDILGGMAREGMRETIADSIHLQGTALHNAGIDRKHFVGNLSPDEISKTPCHLRRVPLRHDELEKKHINDSLASIGCSAIFADVKELRPDNDERFFMQHFHQQNERNKFNVATVESKRCQCETCFGRATEAAAAPVGAANAVPGPAPVPVPVPADLAAPPLQANPFLTAFLCSLAMQGQQMQM